MREILSEDMEEFDKKEENREENKETNIMSSLLVVRLADLQKLMAEQNQLLTSLNTGLRKNTIITDELVFCQRNTERGERDQNLSASSYRRMINFGHRNRRASPKRPGVKLKVFKKD